MRYFMIAGLLLGSFAGCGGDSGPTLYPVSGKLTIGGQPANEIQITFEPIGEGSAAAGNATNGEYTMYSGVRGDAGVQAGKYKVLLQETGDTSYMDAEPGAGDNANSADPTQTSGGIIPAGYNDSPKEIEVTAGENNIDIEI